MIPLAIDSPHTNLTFDEFGNYRNHTVVKLFTDIGDCEIFYVDTESFVDNNNVKHILLCMEHS